MEFIANSILQKFIKTNVRGTILGLIANIAIFILVGLGFYYKTDTTTEFVLTLTVIGIITFVATYQMSYKTAKTINLIVNSIIVGNEITVTTYGYRFLFFYLPPIEKKIAKSTMLMNKSEMPMHTASLKTPEVYVFKCDEKEFYIFYKYFDDKLLECIG